MVPVVETDVQEVAGAQVPRVLVVATLTVYVITQGLPVAGTKLWQAFVDAVMSLASVTALLSVTV